MTIKARIENGKAVVRLYSDGIELRPSLLSFLDLLFTKEPSK